ncbi:hypothetical protein [Mesobacillus jeotgali]|uniref:Uncharacterized protein n=1 Tax=Mesobacillus jeotgali TaxID=129985 RepID=A0ABY9VFZ6_9BACI|nr:hypothetical protein [Mesobacillus jeotgali]WNF22745.1 hypothetical protein RH061_21755 [Mesobacillus jeotgali]
MAVKEDDFYKIKMAGYGRLRPDSVPGFLWGAIVFGGVALIVSLFGVINGLYLASSLLQTSVKVATVIFGAQLLLTILFSITPVAYMLQKLQLIFVTLVAFKFSIDYYLFFFTVADLEDAPQYIFNTGFFLMAGGILLLFLMTIRAFKRVKQGQLRKEGEGLYNIKETKNVLTGAGIFGIVMIAGSLSRAVSNMEGSIGMFFILFLCIILQYSIAIALPEFILLIYGKFKFKAFVISRRNPRSNKKRKADHFPYTGRK